MSGSQEAPLNPLRPYYTPPPIGLKDTASLRTDAGPSSTSTAQVFGGSARELLPDIDYADYLDSSPSLTEWVKDTLDRAMWRYTGILTSQPFDVAKTILQTYVSPSGDGQGPLNQSQHSPYGSDSNDYDDNVRPLFFSFLFFSFFSFFFSPSFSI